MKKPLNHYLNLKSLILFFAFLIASIPNHAQIYPTQYLQQALENNPGLQAQHKVWEAAQKQLDITGALPDPSLSAGFFTPPMKGFMGNQWFDVGLMQMFPWPGTLGKQKSAEEKMAESEFHQYRDERNRLFFEITRLWLEVYRKEQELAIIGRYEEILNSRKDIIYTRYEAGLQRSGIALDIYRMEIQLAELANQKNETREEHRAIVESFNILLGRETDEVIETPYTLNVFYPEIFDTRAAAETFASNPQLKRYHAIAEAAEIQQEVNRLKTRPMLGVGLQYSYFAPGEAAIGQMDGGHMLMPMVSVSLPIFGRKNRAMQHQAELLADAARFRKSDRLNALHTQGVQLQAKVNILLNDNKFYNRQLEITQKTWELVLIAYEAGEEGFDELLRIQDQLIDLEWRLLENKINQHLARAEMDMLLARNIFE